VVFPSRFISLALQSGGHPNQFQDDRLATQPSAASYGLHAASLTAPRIAIVIYAYHSYPRLLFCGISKQIYKPCSLGLDGNYNPLDIFMRRGFVFHVLRSYIYAASSTPYQAQAIVIYAYHSYPRLLFCGISKQIYKPCSLGLDMA
jgi:hypothetical protein